MQQQLIANALLKGLGRDEIKIEKCLNQQGERTKGFEKLFADSFTSTLDPTSFRREVSLRELGGVQRMRASSRGAIDCVLFPSTGLEFKAVRMPRKASSGQKGAMYDVGQLTADFMRIRDCKKLSGGWVIAFVYGPVVIDCRSDGELYRAFHNQMFVDAEVARRDKDGNRWAERERAGQRRALKAWSWDRPWGGKQVPTGVVVARSGNLAAICMPMDRDPHN